MTVLIAEDDRLTRQGLVDVFHREGYATLAAEDGAEALRLWRAAQPDLVCLDVMMPRASGYDVCREIRRAGSPVPILFISAKSEEIDTVVGLDLGADDFIVKPFGLKALTARVRAITRRCLQAKPREEQQTAFAFGDLRVEPCELRAYRDGQPMDLSLRDVKILALLHRERGRAVSRDQMFEECWGMNFLPNSRCLDQQVSQLRKRIERDPAAPRLIRTVHGVGYRFE